MSVTRVPPDPGFKIIWDTVKSMADDLLRALPHLAVAVFVVAMFWAGGAFLRNLIRKATRSHAHANVGLVIGRIGQWLLVFVGGLVGLSVVAPSVGPSDVLSILGVGSVAIGFAFKDILQNFLAGILILLRQPFRVGDQIVVNSYEGTVETIDTRSTLLRTYDGRRVIIPNGEVYGNPVTVNTAYAERRSEYDVGIGYGDDIDNASSVILAALAKIPEVRQDPAAEVIPIDLGPSSVNLRVRWWTNVPRSDVILVKGLVIRAMRLALGAAQIDLPFPVRTVLFHDQTDTYDGDRRREREGWPAGDRPPRPRPDRIPDPREDALANGEGTLDEGQVAQ